MEKQEFFLLIPAIIYGVAIVDLLKIFSHKKNYIEMVGWGIFVMIGLIFAWIELFNKLDTVTNSNFSFFAIIIQAVLFARLSSLITPEEKDTETKEYFFSIRKIFFLLLTIVTVYGMLMRYFVYDDNAPLWMRPFVIGIYLICGYSNKYWLRITLLILILILQLLRVFTEVLIG